MTHTLVLACGNTLRTDDAIAAHVAQRLQYLLFEADTEIVCVRQWIPELAESLSQALLAIFVDASASIPAGEIRILELNGPHEAITGSDHAWTPERLLCLARESFEHAPSFAFLVTVGGASFEHGEQLSHQVADAIPAACERIRALIDCVREKKAEQPDDCRSVGLTRTFQAAIRG